MGLGLGLGLALELALRLGLELGLGLASPSPDQACSPLFLVASSMAYAGRVARVLAERSYASATGGAPLPLAAHVSAAPRSSKGSALRERMQADSGP